MKVKKTILKDHQRMYSLFLTERNEICFGVCCGGFAMEMIFILLSESEVKEYDAHGKPFLDRLALNICKDRACYSDRVIQE